VAWEQAQGGVAALLRECDLPEQHPIDGLLEVVRHSGAMMRMLGFIVSGLEAEGERALFSDRALARFDINLDQKQNIYVEMYGQWADRYARACKLAMDANIDERLVRNAEATTGIFLEAFQGALREAELDSEQAARFSAALADRLRKVTSPLDARRTLQA
jgi:hypothetical protein